MKTMARTDTAIKATELADEIKVTERVEMMIQHKNNE